MTLPQFKLKLSESYIPGKSKLFKQKKIIKLSANESALGVSNKVKKIINKKIELSKYPDSKSEKLKMAISRKFKCDQKKIICGAGSDEVIQLICQLFLKSKDEVIVPQYSFLMYRIYSKLAGGVVRYSKENNFQISIDEIIKKVSRKTKIVFLANPNNPTGTFLNKKNLLDLRKKLRSNILLVVDDAYEEYIKNNDYESGLNLFKKSKNVIILRTFSKIYGLASLRVGWGYGPKRIIDALNDIKPPFNINSVAQLAAATALKDTHFIKKSFKHNIVWGKKLKKFLSQFNIASNNVNTNFLLLNFNDCKYSANNFKKKLESQGVLLRSMESYKIKNALRLTISSSANNNKLINVIKKIFKK